MNPGSITVPPGGLAAACRLAAPGDTLVFVGPHPPLSLPSGWGGAKGAPITLDGSRCTIDGGQGDKAADACIKGLGVHDLVIQGFTTTGGVNGVKLCQAGSDFTRMGARLVVQDLHVSGAAEDGIKVSQADDVQVLRSGITDCGQQGIDLLDVSTFVIRGNDVSGARKAAGITVKGGASAGKITANHVHDITAPGVAGISVGGWIDLLDAVTMKWVRLALAKGAQAHGVSVGGGRPDGNLVERVAGWPLVFIAADSCSEANNTLRPAAIGIEADNRGRCTSGLTSKTAVRVNLDHRQDAARDRLAFAAA